ncbi:hypothetical protein B0J13DRAFT_531532 [Dactylonectria estremocensis]|uniref:C2H2-type domain-containing protein n=1 Tax=Dactylonectria estremocensis TaxID=1079267 RepID=A0A9P9DRT4_9HYPO|nr:hypothetical protein B0J13DRAFT_531532 [Dactylonectria estremocensis]
MPRQGEPRSRQRQHVSEPNVPRTLRRYQQPHAMPRGPRTNEREHSPDPNDISELFLGTSNYTPCLGETGLDENLVLNLMMLQPLSMDVSNYTLYSDEMGLARMDESVAPNLMMPQTLLMDANNDTLYSDEMGQGQVGESQNPMMSQGLSMGASNCTPQLEGKTCLTQGDGNIALDTMAPSKPVLEPGSSQRLYVCDMCRKSFRTHIGLNNHRRVHSAPSQQVYVCDTCQMPFKTNIGLKNHRRVHNTPYYCKQCQRGFRRYQRFCEHLANCGEPRVKHACHICPRTFTSLNKLGNHMEDHTPEQNDPEDLEFGCNYCHKRYRELRRRNRHEREHVQRFVCPGPGCKKDYSRLSGLRKHIKKCPSQYKRGVGSVDGSAGSVAIAEFGDWALGNGGLIRNSPSETELVETNYTSREEGHVVDAPQACILPRRFNEMV